MIITLEQLYNLIADAYAVCVNGVLYFVGYDEGAPYISDNDGGDYVDLSTVDGDIELDNCAASFFVGGQSIRMVFLKMTDPQVDVCNFTPSN